MVENFLSEKLTAIIDVLEMLEMYYYEPINVKVKDAEGKTQYYGSRFSARKVIERLTEGVKSKSIKDFDIYEDITSPVKCSYSGEVITSGWYDSRTKRNYKSLHSLEAQQGALYVEQGLASHTLYEIRYPNIEDALEGDTIYAIDGNEIIVE